MAGVIDAYLSALDRRLAFDSALRLRVRAEIEDHLLEAADSQPDLPREEAERRAVLRFGGAGPIAARFAADALSAQANRTWLMLAIAGGATFVAMRLRRMLIDSSAFDAAPLYAALDRYAFIAALAVGAAGWLLCRHPKDEFEARHVRTAATVASASMLALIASMFGGGLIALSAQQSFDLPSLAVFLLEAAMAAWFSIHVWTLLRRTRAAERALKD